MAKRIHTGGARLKVCEDTGKPYWSLWGADWKDGQDMDPGEMVELSPDAFPPGTRIVILEPDYETSKAAREFYAKLPMHGRCDACGFPNEPAGNCSRSGCCNSD